MEPPLYHNGAERLYLEPRLYRVLNVQLRSRRFHSVSGTLGGSRAGPAHRSLCLTCYAVIGDVPITSSSNEQRGIFLEPSGCTCGLVIISGF